MNPRYTASQFDYNFSKGADWPLYEDFQFLDVEQTGSVSEEILELIKREPKFHKSLIPLMRYNFNGIESAESQSQSWQDIFVLTALNGKTNGTYLEIGAGDPIKNNNTYLLSQFGYQGLSLDHHPILSWGTKRKTNNYVVADALTCDYNKLLKQYHLPKQIDYLQLDIDPEVNTFKALQKLPHQDYRFSVITYETDIFLGQTAIAEQSRSFLTELGYELLIKNVGVKMLMKGHSTYNTWVAFEDWYVDPSAVDWSVVSMFKDVSDDVKLPHKIFCNLEV